MYNRATKYLLAGKNEKAIVFFKKQLRDYAFKECYLNMGNAYRNLGLDSLAIDCYLKAASGDVCFCDGSYGNFPLALNNLGLMSYSSGRVAEAMDFYTAALILDPTYGEAIWNMGNAKLKSSGMTSGWAEYEYRFNRGVSSVRMDTSVPRWDGKTRGDSITVITEQGLGDKIMFGRYLRCLSEYFTEIVIVCHPSLDVLYAPYKCVREVCGNVSIPLCSLAGIFGVVSERWLDGKFEPTVRDGFNIGVVASGSNTHVNNENRSCNSRYLSNLSCYGNLWGLNPTDKPIRNATMLRPETWGSTASTLLGLDVVVSVDTSIVHLAGTLGVPCIMVQPLKETDFRWGLPGSKNVWYDSVIVVDNPGNWDAAFDTVHTLMKAIC